MKTSFLGTEKPLLTLLFCPNTEENAAEMIKRGISEGAEAFCIQTESLLPEYRNPASYRRIFSSAEGLPIYVTNYRHHSNEGLDDDKIADGIITLAESGATLCDVMGDMFCPTVGEMTDDPYAIEKQMKLIEKLHGIGAEVLMSSHVFKYQSAGEVLRIALRQQERGADIVKIVTGADTMNEQLDNLRTTALLRDVLRVPYLFLSGGQCRFHRQVGAMLGCVMYLCSLDDSIEPKPIQPMLRKVKAIRDNWE